MEHVVFYPSADGLPSFRRVGSLDEAVSFVEHLRNVESITEFSVQALTPVPLAFRAYYRVEVNAADGQLPAQPTGSPAAAPASTEPTTPASDQPYSWRTEPVAAATAPVEARDDDRSAEWVAAASVVEPSVTAPVAEAQPAPAAPTPVTAAAAPAAPAAVDAPVADLFAVPAPAAPAAGAPFAAAPPVTPAGTEAAPASSDTDVLPEPEGAPAASGRRSMGFFSR